LLRTNIWCLSLQKKTTLDFVSYLLIIPAKRKRIKIVILWYKSQPLIDKEWLINWSWETKRDCSLETYILCHVPIFSELVDIYQPSLISSYCNCSCSMCNWTPWEGIWMCSWQQHYFFVSVGFYFPSRCLWYFFYFILKSVWCLTLNLDWSLEILLAPLCLNPIEKLDLHRVGVKNINKLWCLVCK